MVVELRHKSPSSHQPVPPTLPQQRRNYFMSCSLEAEEAEEAVGQEEEEQATMVLMRQEAEEQVGPPVEAGPE